jgi:ribonuclease BN (tRNA processing enzyme)
MTVIGCGDAFSSGGRRNTSFLIESKGQKILMDFGATSLYGLNSLGITASDIDVVFISHFHGDHFGGIPFLIINRAYFYFPKLSFRVYFISTIDIFLSFDVSFFYLFGSGFLILTCIEKVGDN